jgi:predicted AAA+ superfamily ATPase
MDKTEIRKIVEKDLLEFFDAKTLLSNNQILMELCIDSTLKAINYTHCCEALKGKKAMTFEDWVKDNGYQSTNKGFTRQGLKFTFNQIHSKYIIYQQSL